ncbi:hypothetical protein EDC01DRAFT_637036 [Geopyxis carbonaria]|nr:hypothetical protein EDC01DRAFT_637036 [Geopyxis carbonaria]
MSSSYKSKPPSISPSFASTSFSTPSLLTPLPPPLPKHFLTREDVAGSISAYQNLSEAAKGYRKALSLVAATASVFGSALESCARCKGAGDAAGGLMNAGGLQYLIASNMHILSESLYRGFEVPLLHEVDSYKEKTVESEETYKKEAGARSSELRKREKQHLRLSNNKTRNLTAFRSTLVDLTQQIDALEVLRYTHYRTSYDLSQETSTRVLDLSALLIRAEVEIFEKIAQKGWDSSGGLDDLIARSSDPFVILTPGGSDEGELFSILPTESILPASQTTVTRTGSIGSAIGASLLQKQCHNLTSALSGGPENPHEGHSNSIFCSGYNNRSDEAGLISSASSADWGSRNHPITESSEETLDTSVAQRLSLSVPLDADLASQYRTPEWENHDNETP